MASRSADAQVIGISGSQGSGKSTFAGILKTRLGVAADALSLDDFYLTHSARAHLAAEIHPLLATRGVPGTHDVQWLRETLGAIKARKTCEVPSFLKGDDDRGPSRTLSIDRLVLEGWCLGATAQADADLEEPINDLERAADVSGTWRRWVNDQVRATYQPLWSEIDFWISLRSPDFATVLAWRTQQEIALPEAKRMSSAALARFVQHYERVTRHLWASPAPGPGLEVVLGPGHEIRSVTAAA